TDGSNPLVLKFPRLDRDHRCIAGDPESRTAHYQQQILLEWEHIPIRLLTPKRCPHAIPILDLGKVMIDKFEVFVTVEPYEEASPIQPVELGSQWINLAWRIATGLAEIHRRRVIHGGIRPDRIFEKKDSQTIEKEDGPIIVFGDCGSLLQRKSFGGLG